MRPLKPLVDRRKQVRRKKYAEAKLEEGDREESAAGNEKSAEESGNIIEGLEERKERYQAWAEEREESVEKPEADAEHKPAAAFEALPMTGTARTHPMLATADAGEVLEAERIMI